MKKNKPLIDFNEILNVDLPKISWKELTINAQIKDLQEINGNIPVSQDEIIINTIFSKKELFASLSRLAKIGIVKKFGSGQKNSTYINLKEFYS